MHKERITQSLVLSVKKLHCLYGSLMSNSSCKIQIIKNVRIEKCVGFQANDSTDMCKI